MVGDEHPVVELTLMSEDEAQVVPLMPDSHGRGHGITLVLGSVSHFPFPFPFSLVPQPHAKLRSASRLSKVERVPAMKSPHVLTNQWEDMYDS